VNLDGKGPAEKTGTLWVEDFRILGDPVVSEVFSGADVGQSGIQTQARRSKGHQVTRQVFEFDRMHVPFSVGYGQFVMEQSYLRGPLLGASIRGKVDFKTRHMNLGGTYVPLQGLNAALCEIPIFGPILTGPGCDGLSGMTFAIQGPMDHPDVVVNPLSMLAPGIFREIFQMTNPNPKVQRRDEAPNPAAEDAVRASSTTVDTPEGKKEDKNKKKSGTQVGSDTIDGWNSQTIENPVKKQ
jgi:hypothetical protein